MPDLLTYAAERADIDAAFERIVNPDAVHEIDVEEAVVVRARDYIPGDDPNGIGDTQGGFRLNILDDSEDRDVAQDLEADRAESEALCGDMTPKLGFIQACRDIAVESGLLPIGLLEIDDTGGAKAVGSILASTMNNPEKLKTYLERFVAGYGFGLEAGDGIGPDRNVDPDMMLTMGVAALALFGNPAFKRRFTNLPREHAFPGRDSSTGRFGVYAFDEMYTQGEWDVPDDQKTLMFQGMGSAGGWAAKVAEQVLHTKGFRTTVVADEKIALVAKRPGQNLIMDQDYGVEGKGRLIGWDPADVEVIESEGILENDDPRTHTGVKFLAAIGGVLNGGNRTKVLGNGTWGMVEIANLGVTADAAIAIDEDMKHNPDNKKLIVPLPYASAGGVWVSLMERWRPTVERAFGRPLTEEDTAHTLRVLSQVGAALMIEAALSGKGPFEASYGIGLQRMYRSRN